MPSPPDGVPRRGRPFHGKKDMLRRSLCLAAGGSATAALLWAALTAAQPAEPSVTEAWARATPAQAENAAAYLTVLSPAADRLVAVATPIARKAEIHTTIMEGDVMRMRPVDGIDLVGGKAVYLKPGGLHVMLFGLQHPLHEGDRFALTLTFAKAGTREVEVVVAKQGAMAPAEHRR
jgi:copper(I)-binding protein